MRNDLRNVEGLPPVKHPLILAVLADAGIPAYLATIEVRALAAVAASNRTLANEINGCGDELHDIASMSGGGR